jgi:hypothetical protein
VNRFILCRDPPEHLAPRQVTGNYGAATSEVGEGTCFRVKSQIVYTRPFIGPMAGEADIGQDRPDVPVEPHGLGGHFLSAARVERQGASYDQNE